MGLFWIQPLKSINNITFKLLIFKLPKKCSLKEQATDNPIPNKKKYQKNQKKIDIDTSESMKFYTWPYNENSSDLLLYSTK
jgi:hypothetical protein